MAASQAVIARADENTDVTLRFESGARRSASLAEIVREANAPLDFDAFAPRMIARPPRALDETPYRGVRCVVGWPGFRAPADAPPRDAGEAIALLRAELAAAVDRAIGSARRIAVFAGGGLDSAGLLAVTIDRARRRGATVFALALDFGGPGDDRPHLRALESSLGCEVLRVRPDEAKGRLDLLRGVDAMPFAWPASFLEIEAFTRARRHGAELVLSGIGGDEMFDGNPWDLASLTAQGRFFDAVRIARKTEGFARPRFATLQWPLRRLAARHVPLAVRRLRARRGPSIPTWAGPRMVRWIRDDNERATERLLVADDTTPTPLDFHRVQLLSIRHLVFTACGVLRRDPFMDPRLRAVAARVPRELLLHGNMRRGLFREMFRDVLPESLRMRQDKAHVEPALDQFIAANGGLDAVRPYASVERLADAGLVEPRAFMRDFDRWDADAWTMHWPVLASEAFLRARG